MADISDCVRIDRMHYNVNEPVRVELYSAHPIYVGDVVGYHGRVFAVCDVLCHLGPLKTGLVYEATAVETIGLAPVAPAPPTDEEIAAAVVGLVSLQQETSEGVDK